MFDPACRCCSMAIKWGDQFLDKCVYNIIIERDF